MPKILQLNGPAHKMAKLSGSLLSSTSSRCQYETSAVLWRKGGGASSCQQSTDMRCSSAVLAMRPGLRCSLEVPCGQQAAAICANSKLADRTHIRDALQREACEAAAQSYARLSSRQDAVRTLQGAGHTAVPRKAAACRCSDAALAPHLMPRAHRI
jgi:hypothetical protein